MHKMTVQQRSQNSQQALATQSPAPFCGHSFCSHVMVALLLIVFFGAPLTCFAASDSYTLPRYMTYSFTLHNPTHQSIDNAELWTYAPVALTSTQQRLQLRATAPFAEFGDRHGNSIVHVAIPHLAPYDTNILTISVDLALAKAAQPISETDSSRYLQPEAYCEVDDPHIVALAQQLIADTHRQTAQNIFQWVSRNITGIGYLKEPRGARYALEYKQGDCTEFMYLFVALCRAAGIPARGLGGYVVDRNAILKPGDYHNWAEFYLDGVWHVADPQKQVLMDNQSHYLVLHIIGDMPDDHPMRHYQRFRYRGQGLEVDMN